MGYRFVVCNGWYELDRGGLFAIGIKEASSEHLTEVKPLPVEGRVADQRGAADEVVADQPGEPSRLQAHRVACTQHARETSRGEQAGRPGLLPGRPLHPRSGGTAAGAATGGMTGSVLLITYLLLRHPSSTSPREGSARRS